MKQPKGVSLAFAALLILTLTTACAQPVARAAQPKVPPASIATAGPEEEVVGVAASYFTLQSLDELVDRSTLICIGQVSGPGASFNMSTDPNDYSKNDPEIYILGQVYRVEVQRCLKGEAGRSIDVIVPEGYLSDRVQWTQANIDKARKLDAHKPTPSGQRYLLFLESARVPALPETQGKSFWVGVGEPSRFALKANGQAEVDSPWEYASLAFPAQSQASLIGQVERLVNAKR